MEFFAHSDGTLKQDNWHKLSEHLEETGRLAQHFLSHSGCGSLGRIAGLLHDLGKYTSEFQKRLTGNPARVNHSTAGAKIATDLFGFHIAKMLSYCIAGHHTGLANGVNGESIRSLEDRLREDILQPNPIWRRELSLPQLTPPKIKPAKNGVGFSGATLIRMVFSALVDADYLDTERYFTSVQHNPVNRGGYPSLSALLARLERAQAHLQETSKFTKLNSLRDEILQHVIQQSNREIGTFTLTVPTGGGKTLTSLHFALRHAIRNGLDRLIYVIPYTSIVEQTAWVFKDVLKVDTEENDFILEHHSAVDEETTGNRESRRKLDLAEENWDVPIIVTTAVQFFESLFANRPSRCRKVHNIANSIVVLDEAQTLPLSYLQACVAILDELSRNWRTSVVLCTATQPALAAKDGFDRGFENLVELAPNPKQLYDQGATKRTRIVHRGVIDVQTLAEGLELSTQVLCILNTRKHVREIYNLLVDTEGACHLSTLMCATHRRDQLARIRASLKAGKPVRLIATSLVEAGVDIDFPTVWRAEAGLESIIQAAGRCNREGSQPKPANVYVFEPAEDRHKGPPDIQQLSDAFRAIQRKFASPMSLDAINEYFRRVYWTKGVEGLDTKDILSRIEERSKRLDFPFETIAREFNFIETSMVPLIVAYKGDNDQHNKVDTLIGELISTDRISKIARQLQPYMVQVSPFVREKLLLAGAAEVIQQQRFEKQFVKLSNPSLYRYDIGLTWEDPTFVEAEAQVV